MGQKLVPTRPYRGTRPERARKGHQPCPRSGPSRHCGGRRRRRQYLIMAVEGDQHEIICRRCGTHNEPGTIFCGDCGAFLEWEGEAVGPVEAPIAAPASSAEGASEGDVTSPSTPVGNGEAGDGEAVPGPAEVAGELASRPSPPASPPPTSLPSPSPVPMPPLGSTPSSSGFPALPPTSAAPTAAAGPGPVSGSAPPTPSPPPGPPATVLATPFPVAPTTAPAPAQPSPVLPEPFAPKRPLSRRPPGEYSRTGGDLTCSSCGEGNSANRHFCRRCGTKLPMAEPAPASSSVTPLSWWRRLLAWAHRRRHPDVSPGAPATANPPSEGAPPTTSVAASAAGGSAGGPGRGAAGPKLPLPPKLGPRGEPLPKPTRPPATLPRPSPRAAPAPAAPRLTRPARMRIPGPKLVSLKMLGLLIIVLALIILGGAQIAHHGLRGEASRIRSFFYPNYRLISLTSVSGLRAEPCEPVAPITGPDTTTVYWYTPPRPAEESLAPLATGPSDAPVLNVELSRADLSRVAITLLPVPDAPSPRYLGIQVDGNTLERLTVASSPSFQVFAVHYPGLPVATTADLTVSIWLLGTASHDGVSTSTPNICALTGIAFYSRH